MDINYKIELHTDWHCGSGLSAGADIDSLVVRDENGLPFVPGKTMKGLVREAVEDIIQFSKLKIDENEFNRAFGFFDDKENKERGEMFFTNAELPEDERDAIIKGKLQEYLYHDLACTALENGIAKDHSLRKIEVTVPCTLYGEILYVDDKLADIVIDALKYIKRIGVNRNRGLGRCTITAQKGGEK